MKTLTRLDHHYLECSCEPLEGQYYRISWFFRRVEVAPSPEPTHGESYVYRASSAAEALSAVQARAALMLRSLLWTQLSDEGPGSIPVDEDNEEPQARGVRPPDR